MALFTPPDPHDDGNLPVGILAGLVAAVIAVFYAIGAYFGYRYATRPLRPAVVVPSQAP